MVDFLISAGLVWGAVCIICFCAFMALYLHFALEQARSERASRQAEQAAASLDNVPAALG